MLCVGRKVIEMAHSKNAGKTSTKYKIEASTAHRLFLAGPPQTVMESSDRCHSPARREIFEPVFFVCSIGVSQACEIASTIALTFSLLVTRRSQPNETSSFAFWFIELVQGSLALAWSSETPVRLTISAAFSAVTPAPARIMIRPDACCTSFRIKPLPVITDGDFPDVNNRSNPSWISWSSVSKGGSVELEASNAR